LERCVTFGWWCPVRRAGHRQFAPVRQVGVTCSITARYKPYVTRSGRSVFGWRLRHPIEVVSGILTGILAHEASYGAGYTLRL
jgi:hypothetical protein